KAHYPLNMIDRPFATLAAKPAAAAEAGIEGKELEKYELRGPDGLVKGTVRIVHSESERRPCYEIRLPRVTPFTRAYLDNVKAEVSADMPLAGTEKGGDESSAVYAARRARVSERIGAELGPPPATLAQLADIVLNEMYGLGEIEALIGDAALEEIIINSASLPVSVYHKRHGWMKTTLRMSGEDATKNYAEQIARKVGRQISTLNPILDAHLSRGDRANATLYPVSTHGNTITLRLFARNPWTIVSFLKKENGAMSPEMAAMLWQAMQYEMNVLIAGGTASGKTSALNSLLSLIQPHQRIVTIEDTRELLLPKYQWNWVPLVTRQPNPEGAGEITMLDLVVNALRMRPDRIVMGEIRRRREAEVLFEAMHTGHSVYSTMHADTGSQVIKRLLEPPIEVPASEVEDVQLLLVQYRDRRKNIRRTLELSEVVPDAGGPSLSRIFSWKPRSDSFERVKAPNRYIEQMNLHTGLTENEIMEDQKSKMAVLKWMLKAGLEGIEDVGRVMKAYYADEGGVAAAAAKGVAPGKVL
ncbi:MAG: type II/IV secretion system ATPase subunit, partial [Candidatus Micrarchaeota archaeon]